MHAIDAKPTARRQTQTRRGVIAVAIVSLAFGASSVPSEPIEVLRPLREVRRRAARAAPSRSRSLPSKASHATR
jgi:hypothetical protein